MGIGVGTLVTQNFAPRGFKLCTSCMPGPGPVGAIFIWSPDIIPGSNLSHHKEQSVCEIESELLFGQLFSFVTLFVEILPKVKVMGTFFWMCLNGLYLDTEYEVCRWNSIRGMASFFFYNLFLGKFYLDKKSRSLVLESLNAF